MGITIAQATTDADKEKVFAFRYRTYVEELGLTLPSADHTRRRLWDPLDEIAVSHVVLDNEQVVGSLRIVFLADMPDPSPLVNKFALGPAIEAMGKAAICTTSRFIIDPRLRHSLAIFRLMEAGYVQGVERGVRLNYGDCSPHLLPFYEQLGYRRYTKAYNDSEFGFKFPILMLGHDCKRLEKVRSPLIRVARRYPDDPNARTWFERTYPKYLTIESATFLEEGMFFNRLCDRLTNNPLQHLKILHGLERAEADRFLSKATVIQASPGDYIVRQGEPGDALFVLLAGLVEVMRGDAQDEPKAILRAGDMFGELSLASRQLRTSNVRAKTCCEILVLSSDIFSHFQSTEPASSAKVLRNLQAFGGPVAWLGRPSRGGTSRPGTAPRSWPSLALLLTTF